MAVWELSPLDNLWTPLLFCLETSQAACNEGGLGWEHPSTLALGVGKLGDLWPPNITIIPKPGPDDALWIFPSHWPSGFESNCPGCEEMYLNDNTVPWSEGSECPLRFPSQLTWTALGFSSLPLTAALPTKSTSSDWLFSHGQTGGIDCSPREAICKDTLGKRVRERGTWIKTVVLGFSIVRVLLHAMVSLRASPLTPLKDLASEPNGQAL